MKRPIRAVKTSLEEILNGHPANTANTFMIVPTKATMLAFNTGALLQDQAGTYYVCVQGEWHRYGDNTLPQVDAFDQLNAVGLTLLKKDIIKEIFRGQEIPSESGHSPEETSEAVATDKKRKGKSKDRA